MNDVSAPIGSRTLDEIAVGDSVRVERALSIRDLELICALAQGAGHLAPDGGAATAWAALMLAAVIGGRLPGVGSIVEACELQFHGPLAAQHTLDLTLTVRATDAATRRVTLDCVGTGPGGARVIEGRVRVVAAATKGAPPEEAADIVVEERGAKFRRLVRQARSLDPILTAVVYPVEPNALAGAAQAAGAGLIVPILVGPEARIRAAAKEAGIDPLPWRIVNAQDSAAAAQAAACMARDGEAHALMKGSLHTDEFLHPIVLADMKLRTDTRLSHVFVMDVPAYDRLLLITDGAINIAPDLEAKRDIVQNAVLLAHALGIATPRVAVLSAVEEVNPRIVSTLDAAALCKMAERGQITGAVLDGPLAFDNAVSKVAAQIKHIRSEVAGQADILVAPDLDAGNMIAKQLEYLAASEAAGVVLGARVPIVLTSRADGAQSRLASCAVAALLHAHDARGEA